MEVLIKKLSAEQMQQINGGADVIACAGVGLLTIGAGLNGLIRWTAFGFLAADSILSGYAACFG